MSHVPGIFRGAGTGLERALSLTMISGEGGGVDATYALPALRRDEYRLSKGSVSRREGRYQLLAPLAQQHTIHNDSSLTWKVASESVITSFIPVINSPSFIIG
jgi:hypothetical protein